MAGVTKEQVESARKMNLLEYKLQYEPDDLVRRGNEYRSKTHSSLAINPETGVWNYFAGHIGGRSALDFLTKVEHMPFVDAVERLSSAEVKPLLTRPAPNKDKRETDREFKVPARYRYENCVMRYLTGRGIDQDIVQQCIHQGTIYESYPHHNVVFIGKNDSGTPKFASLRGTMKDSHFRMDQPGSDKRFSFRYIPPGCDTHYYRWVAAFEAPIDALSYVTLNRRYHCNPITWDKLPCISLSGTAPAALLQYLRDHSNVDTIYLGLDNDDAGRTGMKKIAEAIHRDPDLSKQVRHIFAMPPSSEQGKDYNEVLQTMLANENGTVEQKHSNLYRNDTMKELQGEPEKNFFSRLNDATVKAQDRNAGHAAPDPQRTDPAR